MYLKSLNLFVSSSCTFCILKRCLSSEKIENVSDVIRNIFNLEENEAKTYESKHGLHKCDIEQMKDSIQFCKSIGYAENKLIKYPSLLKTNALTLDQRYLALKEGGFCSVTPDVLTKFRKLTNTSITSLKNRMLIPRETIVANSLISYLDPKPDDFNVSDLFDDGIKWSTVHVTIIKRYLMWRLDANYDEVESLFRVYKNIPSKSLTYLSENIKIAEELNFLPLRKLLKFGYLLHNYPKYPRTVLEIMPNLANADLKKAMRVYPKLVMVSPRNYKKIYDMLKEAEIPNETIQKAMNIFHVSPETVKYRLRQICQIPEFRIHLQNPKVLRLIVHHNRALSRLSFLQEVQLKCASLHIMSSDGDAFNFHIREGKDKNVRSEVINFVKHLLKTDSELVTVNLIKHPFYLKVPLLQIEDTYMYLQKFGFKKDALLRTVQVLLYPKEKIEEAINKMANESRVITSRLASIQKLNLVLYYIEKDYHFTGNGIWKDGHV